MVSKTAVYRRKNVQGMGNNVTQSERYTRRTKAIFYVRDGGSYIIGKYRSIRELQRRGKIHR